MQLNKKSFVFRGEEFPYKRLLTRTSKMPGWSFSIPARQGKVGGRPFTVCTALCKMPCYAKKGRYTSPAVREAQNWRLEVVLEALEEPGLFTQLMGKAFTACAVPSLPYFRGHDSGDFFCASYVEEWTWIAEEWKSIRFYFPTKSYVEPGCLPFLQTFASLPNVTLRPSALAPGLPAPVVPGLAAGIEVRREGFTCPASRQGNQCLSCRLCWDEPGQSLSYHLH